MYNKRTWLNKNSLSSTGSIVCFSGNATYGDKDPYFVQFVEVSDCNGKVKIHQGKFETNLHFLKKVKRMKDELLKYIEYLENN